MSEPTAKAIDSTLVSTPATQMSVGRYVIERCVGAGGMGEVYRATDPQLHRTVAIKMLLPETASDGLLRKRFLNEARAASALNHPNIVVLHDICTDGQRDFLVMEFVEGQTLKEITAQQNLSSDRLTEIGSQVALALSAAHAAGIVHRDIKPANIMVTKAGVVKVLDFGVAKLAKVAGDTQLTGQGQIVGTVAYMSPEQVRGEEADFRSDLFSLGCVLYEAATGVQPFQSTSALGLIHEISSTEPKPMNSYRPELAPEFVRLVMRCLAKNASDRPESAAEVATELKVLSLPAHEVKADVPSSRRTVAVLPLKVRGPSTEQYLAVALAEAIAYSLSSTANLVVLPISRMMRYANDEIDWTSVARDLGVDLVLEGSAQIAGGKIRVLMQVHQASNKETLASLKQDGDSADLFALQDGLTDKVNAVFVPKNNAAEKVRIVPTNNPEAFELYLRAVDRQVRVDKYEMSSAIELLTRATELEPDFADAWGLLAEAYTQMGSHMDPNPKWFDLGEQAIARALELDPVQCTALCARSMIAWSPSRSFQHRAALRALNAAIKINPSKTSARHLRSAVLWHMGFLEEAERDALELELTSPALGLMHQGAITLQRGEFDKSAEFYARALALEPNGILNHLLSPVAILYGGHVTEARAAIEKTKRMFPDESFVTGLEAIVMGIDGDHKRAEALADEAVQSSRSLTHTHHTWHSCAAAYALCDKADKAVDQIERCAEMGLPDYRLFEADPYLKGLRGNARFADLMQKLRREHAVLGDEFGLAH